jgi:hypothetical protein
MEISNKNKELYELAKVKQLLKKHGLLDIKKEKEINDKKIKCISK